MMEQAERRGTPMGPNGPPNAKETAKVAPELAMIGSRVFWCDVTETVIWVSPGIAQQHLTVPWQRGGGCDVICVSHRHCAHIRFTAGSSATQRRIQQCTFPPQLRGKEELLSSLTSLACARSLYHPLPRALWSSQPRITLRPHAQFLPRSLPGRLFPTL